MQRMWNSYLAVASMIPNVTMLILNAVFGHRQVISMKTFIIGVLNHNNTPLKFCFSYGKIIKITIPFRYKTQPRLLVSLVLVILLFAFTAGMTKVDTDTWQSDFMTLTLITVVLINLNAAIFQGRCRSLE